jgi:hypothetical protein
VLVNTHLHVLSCLQRHATIQAEGSYWCVSIIEISSVLRGGELTLSMLQTRYLVSDLDLFGVISDRNNILTGMKQGQVPKSESSAYRCRSCSYVNLARLISAALCTSRWSQAHVPRHSRCWRRNKWHAGYILSPNGRIIWRSLPSQGQGTKAQDTGTINCFY